MVAQPDINDLILIYQLYRSPCTEPNGKTALEKPSAASNLPGKAWREATGLQNSYHRLISALNKYPMLRL
ncbi:MAG: hypothetical protein ACR2O0_09045, partial [Rhizobiaceae bacterium]